MTVKAIPEQDLTMMLTKDELHIDYPDDTGRTIPLTWEMKRKLSMLSYRPDFEVRISYDTQDDQFYIFMYRKSFNR